MSDVMKSKDETMNASIWTRLRNWLYDPNIINPPQEMLKEKNICSAAFLHVYRRIYNLKKNKSQEFWELEILPEDLIIYSIQV